MCVSWNFMKQQNYVPMQKVILPHDHLDEDMIKILITLGYVSDQ